MLKKIDKWVSYAENAMLVIGMLSTTFILFANVIMRFCFKSGIVWSNEYANYAIIWIVCGGCGACVRSDAHMRITAIPDMIKNEKVKQVLALIVYVICLAFSVVILNSGSRLVGSIPLWWIYLSFPVGGGVMTFRFILKLIDSVKKLIGKGGAQA